MWISEHHPRLLKKELRPTCKLMNHPRWMFHPVPDHHNKETQVWHLAPRIHEDPERNQTASNLRGELQNKRPRTHQGHHPLPHLRVNPRYNRQHLYPHKGDQVCHPVPKRLDDHRLYHQSGWDHNKIDPQTRHLIQGSQVCHLVPKDHRRSVILDNVALDREHIDRQNQIGQEKETEVGPHQ